MDYRIYRDVDAIDKNDAIVWADECFGSALNMHGTLENSINVKEQHFTDEEEAIILEAARMALNDADSYDEIANKLDLSDEVLFALREKIQNATKD